MGKEAATFAGWMCEPPHRLSLLVGWLHFSMTGPHNCWGRAPSELLDVSLVWCPRHDVGWGVIFSNKPRSPDKLKCSGPMHTTGNVSRIFFTLYELLWNTSILGLYKYGQEHCLAWQGQCHKTPMRFQSVGYIFSNQVQNVHQTASENSPTAWFARRLCSWEAHPERILHLRERPNKTLRGTNKQPAQRAPAWATGCEGNGKTTGACLPLVCRGALHHPQPSPCMRSCTHEL